MADKLGSGSQFPRLSMEMLDGSQKSLPDDLSADFTVVLLYRGHW